MNNGFGTKVEFPSLFTLSLSTTTAICFLFCLFFVSVTPSHAFFYSLSASFTAFTLLFVKKEKILLEKKRKAMVGEGIFSRLSSYKIFHPSPSNKRELLIPKGDEVADTGDDLVMEFNVEFKPIDHPLEPLDEDRPVKCPLQNSSVLRNGEARMKRSASERISRKRPELRVLNEGAEVSTKPQVHAVCKRHQTLPRNHSRPPLSRSRSISSGILQML